VCWICCLKRQLLQQRETKASSDIKNNNHYFGPGMHDKYVCLSVHSCISKTTRSNSRTSPNFCAYWLRSWFSPSLWRLHVLHFRFCGRRHVLYASLFTIMADKKHKTDISTRTGERTQNGLYGASCIFLYSWKSITAETTASIRVIFTYLFIW